MCCDRNPTYKKVTEIWQGTIASKLEIFVEIMFYIPVLLMQTGNWYTKEEINNWILALHCNFLNLNSRSAIIPGVEFWTEKRPSKLKDQS